MEPSETIGQRIKEVRGELSQKEFGRRIGLSQTAVTALETNQSEPRLGTFNKIVDAFKVNPEWLRTGKGIMSADPLADVRNAIEVIAPRVSARQGGSLEISQPTREEYAALQDENRKLREELAKQSGKLTAVEDERTRLFELVKKPEASADAATLYETVDEIASEFRFAPQVEVPEIQRFVPQRRQAPVTEPVGFRIGA